MSTVKFQLGQTVMTRGAAAAFEEANEQPFGYIKRHVTGDWGELDEHDRQEKRVFAHPQSASPVGLHAY